MEKCEYCGQNMNKEGYCNHCGAPSSVQQNNPAPERIGYAREAPLEEGSGFSSMVLGILRSRIFWLTMVVTSIILVFNYIGLSEIGAAIGTFLIVGFLLS